MMKIAKLSLLLSVVFTSAAVAQVNKNEFHPSLWADLQIGSVHGRWFFIRLLHCHLVWQSWRRIPMRMEAKVGGSKGSPSSITKN